MNTINKTMKNILNYICIFFIISCNAGNDKKELNSNETSLSQEIILNNQQKEKEIWKFYKISENPIFETKKSDLLSINKKISNTNIVLSENKININNYCQNIEYVDLKKKSFEYFTNKDFLERYSKELLKQGIRIGDSINIIRSVIPNEECEYPFGEILKIDDYLIVLYEGYLIYYIKEPLKNILHKSKEELIIKENEIETVKLPFSFYNYFKDEYSEKKYPSYNPTDKLINFLVEKGYDAESYKCFIIKSDDKILYLVIEIQRGDSNYYVLLTSNDSKIIDFKEIGSIGDENPVTFKILQNLSINKYHDLNESNKPFEILKIDNNRKIGIK